MTAQEVLKQLEKLGTAQTKKTFARHGCPEPFFGVKVGDMKKIVKKIKTNTPLAKALYSTGNSDAMYLAGLIANGGELSRKDLDDWVRRATWSMISEYTVAWVASENPYGWELALEWIESPDDKISSAGWNTLAAILSMKDDQELDLRQIEKMLDRVVKTIHQAPNRTRYTMNNFIISLGVHVKPLTNKALEASAKIGKVEVDMGETSCKVPQASEYINKAIAKGHHGKKPKTVKC